MLDAGKAAQEPAERVSVVMTCFNEGPWLRQAVRSVLDQTAAEAIESIIIVDDGSDEPTLAVLDEVAGWDSRITTVHAKGNGLAKNRNLAVSRTSAGLVALLDSDDYWHPTKIARQLDLIRRNPSAGVVYTGFWLFDDGQDELRSVIVTDHARAKDSTLAYFLLDPPIVPSTIVFRRGIFDYVGGFDESIQVFEDTEFYLRLSQTAGLAAIAEPLTYKRNHRGSMTSKRTNLMMHHAYVAFHFARREPRLLPYVGRRLAERARKLGNLEAKDGNGEAAAHYYGLALSLDPLRPMNWGTFLAHKLGGNAIIRSMRASYGGL